MVMPALQWASAFSGFPENVETEVGGLNVSVYLTHPRPATHQNLCALLLLEANKNLSCSHWEGVLVTNGGAVRVDGACARSSNQLTSFVCFCVVFYRGCASHQCDTYCVCDPAAVALLMGAHQTSMCQANWLFSWSGEQASAFLKAAHKTGMGDNTPFSLFFF